MKDSDGLLWRERNANKQPLAQKKNDWGKMESSSGRRLVTENAKIAKRVTGPRGGEFKERGRMGTKGR